MLNSVIPEPIYIDHHATTPCDPRVVERMLPFFTEIFGNPASLTHAQGRRAASALEDARISVARFFGFQANEVVFTSGASESNNLALNLLEPGQHLITSAMEHRSILAPAKRLEERGVAVTVLDPDREGFISRDSLLAAFRPETRMVSIEAANGEIGTLQPIGALAAATRERGVLFHTDATQAVGKVSVDLENVDLVSLSAHKFYGPKGTGALLARRSVRLRPLILGGGQERTLRSGTVNVAGAVGLAAALQLRAEELVEEGERLTILRNGLWDALTAAIEGVSIHGPRALRLPGNLSLSFARVEADSLIVAMRRFSLSSGSACSSGERGPSPMLRAIGAEEASALGAIRIGLGKSNTEEQMNMLVEDLQRAVARLREIAAP